jgi:hypothetical protein
MRDMYLLFVIGYPGIDHDLKFINLSIGDFKLKAMQHNFSYE